MINSHSPIIISASRATDIPAFYGDWFIDRMKKGYVIKQNPFNGKKYKISFDKTQLIVFWTKDPKPFLKQADVLNEYCPNYYFQYTLNDYDKNIEVNLPHLNKRIETFIQLSEIIGKEKVIWRFDPLILTDKTGINELINKIETTADKIYEHTNKLVFSFIDIEPYKKVKNKIKKSGMNICEFNIEKKEEFAGKLEKLNQKYNFELAACSEDIDLSRFGIHKNKCIDDNLIKSLFPENELLMNFLNQKKLKDKGQRKNCGCIISKDIGQYNTCTHSCVYCYAVSSKETALKNYKKHLTDHQKESIIHINF